MVLFHVDGIFFMDLSLILVDLFRFTHVLTNFKILLSFNYQMSALWLFNLQLSTCDGMQRMNSALKGTSMQDQT